MWARIAGLLLMALLSGAPSGASAQPYPNRPIKLVVPYPPGGGVDLMGRIVAENLSENLGVPVVVTHQPGGAGTVGSDAVRRADPDGYTLLFQASVFIFGPQVVKATPYNPLSDFTPIAHVSDVPMILVVNPKIEANNLTELVEIMRKRSRDFNVAVSAPGSAGHLTTLAFLRYLNVNPGPEIVLYRGTGLGLTDVIAGVSHVMTETVGVLMPQVKSGRVRGLAVTGSKRSPLASDVPTFAEAGGPKIEIASWYGVWGPPKLPPAIVERLSKALEQVTASPAFVSRLEALGITPRYKPPAEFKAFIDAEARWGLDLLKAMNVKAAE
jgi:tripartite-type tricarboxylate transporter receptor subunit TctC